MEFDLFIFSFAITCLVHVDWPADRLRWSVSIDLLCEPIEGGTVMSLIQQPAAED